MCFNSLNLLIFKSIKYVEITIYTCLKGKLSIYCIKIKKPIQLLLRFHMRKNMWATNLNPLWVIPAGRYTMPRESQLTVMKNRLNIKVKRSSKPSKY
jgi:hypothetical protein